MIHGPYSTLNPHSICMNDGSCYKDVPKNCVQETKENVNGYPTYQWKDNSNVVIKCISGTHTEVGNQFVVLYNPFLLKYFHSYSNVEILASLHSVKYLHKYAYKEHDCTNIQVVNDSVTIIHDEVTTYLNTRYVGATEAVY